MEQDEIGMHIVDASVALHRELGPGLLESVYEVVLARELTCRGMQVARQTPVPIFYRGIKFEEAFKADLIVDDKVIVELKSLKQLTSVHKKQLLTYLRLTNMKLGYLGALGERKTL